MLRYRWGTTLKVLVSTSHFGYFVHHLYFKMTVINEKVRGVKDRIGSIFIFTFSLSFIPVNTNNLEPKNYNCVKVIITILLHLTLQVLNLFSSLSILICPSKSTQTYQNTDICSISCSIRVLFGLCFGTRFFQLFERFFQPLTCSAKQTTKLLKVQSLTNLFL